MSKFEEVFEENYRFYIDDSCEYRYANSKEFGKVMYESGQQSKQNEIDDLKAQLKAVHDSRASFVEYCGTIEKVA